MDGVLIALLVIICIIIGGATMLRDGNLGRGKYRT